MNPEVARLENLLYGSVLTAVDVTNRTDLVAILLTGVPGLNFTGPKKADLLRLNTSIAPTASVGAGNRLGVLAGDLAGFPNGRRLEDDVVDIEVRAIAQGYGPFLHSLLGLPDKSPNNQLGDGVDANDKSFLAHFPYVAIPTKATTFRNGDAMSRRARPMWVAVAIAIGAIAAAAPHLTFRGSPASAETLRLGPAIGMPGAPPTSANGLRQRIGEMEARLKDRPADAGAAMLLADALLRQARATSDGRPANRAATILAAVLKDDPGQYDALRLLGAIELSRHRFRDALDVARRARDLRPGDAWNYGVLGDALIELGEYR